MSIAWSFPRGYRNKKGMKIGGLGPGAYDPKIHPYSQTPKWTMRSRYTSKNKKFKAPGPGKYTHKLKSDGPKFSIRAKTKLPRSPNEYNPGPGTYSTKKQNSRPKYSIRQKTKFIGSKSQAPGPGTYEDINSNTYKLKNPKWTMRGKNNNSKKQKKSRNPGPGTYPISSSLNKKSTKFGTSMRSKLVKKGGPAPWNYDIKGSSEINLLNKKGKSIGQKLPSRQKETGPDPGIYDPNVNFSKTSAPSYGFGFEKRGEMADNKVGPPPNNYDPSFSLTKPAGPNWGLGSGKQRAAIKDKGIPGPGNYDSRTKGTSGPKYSIGAKFNDNKKESKPGPGNYNPKLDAIDPNKKALGFSKGQRTNVLKQDGNPGPGHYPNPSTLKGKGTKFGSDNRNAFKSKKGPGPGTYAYQGDIDVAISKKKGPSLGTRTNQLSKDQTPAPGIYDPNVNLTKPQAPGWKMGTGARTESKHDKTLDPGAYNPKLNLVKQSGPNWGIGTSQRGNLALRNDNPAPGNYKVRKDINDGPLFSMGQKIDHQMYSTVPGPGTHNPDIVLVKPKRIGTKFGKEKQRIGKSTKNTPGPGHYLNPSGLHKNGPKFGSQMRAALASKSEAPGPGNYTLTSSFDPANKRGPTIGQKLPMKQNNDKVSPGLYDPGLHLTKPSIKGGRMGIKTKGVMDIDNANPAPGHYNPELGTSMPEWKFGSGKQRASSQKRKAPGPGTYGSFNPYSLKKKPKFAMGVKLSKKSKKKNPGPGAYDPRSNLVKESKSKGGKISVGKSRRRKANRKSKDPGPGQYDVRYKYGKYGFKFGTGGRHWMSRSQGPGPGTYNLIPAFANVPAYNR